MNRKRIVLLLRSVVIATSAYVVLGTHQSIRLAELLFVGLFALSNALLAVVPRRIVERPQFGPVLLLVDTAFILFVLSWRHGLSQDVLLVYFFTVFLTTVGDSLASIATGGALVSGLYGYWLWHSSPHPLDPEQWLRLPFFFLIAVFYGALMEQLKAEQRRRKSAEQESQHLRVLLDLAGVFSESHATREFVLGLGRFITEACPELHCRVMLREEHSADASASGLSLPLSAHGHTYGVLAIETSEPRELTEREHWLCQMVAHAAAGALYAAEQSTAAQSAGEVKEQFLATVSHELRTPLHAILGYTDILSMSLPDDDPLLRDSVERMRVNACRMQDLVEQVLGFAEVRAGQRSVRPENVRIGELFEELAPVIRELLYGKPVEFSWSVAAELTRFPTDRRKLKQMLVSLLSNAAKFTEEGRVTLSASVDADGCLEIRVTDSGVGIPSTDLTAVFEDFRQVDNSLSRRFGGLGLGLAFARELVTILGGTMTLDSEVGQGTAVCVRLPRAGDDAVAASAAGHASAAADFARVA